MYFVCFDLFMIPEGQLCDDKSGAYRYECMIRFEILEMSIENKMPNKYLVHYNCCVEVQFFFISLALIISLICRYIGKVHTYS